MWLQRERRGRTSRRSWRSSRRRKGMARRRRKRRNSISNPITSRSQSTSPRRRRGKTGKIKTEKEREGRVAYFKWNEEN